LYLIISCPFVTQFDYSDVTQTKTKNRQKFRKHTLKIRLICLNLESTEFETTFAINILMLSAVYLFLIC